MAAFLAAGAWTTVSADVVKVTPAVGGTYLIGTDVQGDVIEDLLQASSLKTTNGASSTISDMKEAYLLEPTNGDGEDGWFYLKTTSDATSSANQYVVLWDNSANSYVRYESSNTNAIKFKFSGKKLVVAKDITVGNATFRKDDEVVLTAGGRFSVAWQDGAKGTELAFAVYNDDVNATIDLADDKSPLQASFNADEYYLIAADGSNLLKDDGTGTLSADAAVTATNVDNYLWKITTGTAADGKTTTYTFTNKESGKVAIVNNIDKFIVEGSAASFKLFLNADASQALAADFTVGTAVDFGIYKSPILNVNGETLNALLGEGFNMTVKKSATD